MSHHPHHLRPPCTTHEYITWTRVEPTPEVWTSSTWIKMDLHTSMTQRMSFTHWGECILASAICMYIHIWVRIVIYEPADKRKSAFISYCEGSMCTNWSSAGYAALALPKRSRQANTKQRSLILHWWDGLEVIKHLFSNSLFASCMDFNPYHKLEETSNGQEPVYGKFMSANCAWEIQVWLHLNSWSNKLTLN